MEKNTTNMFPNITNIYTDRPYTHLKNEYSILNRYRGDQLGNFSLQLYHKLPQINRRLHTLNQKEEEYERNQKENSQLKNMQKEVNAMKEYLLNRQKQFSHKCCCSHANNSIMYPMMMYGGYPSHNNNCISCGEPKNPDRYPNQRRSHRNPSNKSITSSISTLPNNKKKKPNPNRKKLLSKFRKAAYAVYFCIYLKNFSIKFTKNRYQLFKNRYLINYGQKVKEDSYKITKSIEVIDILELIRKAPVGIQNFSTLQLASNKAIENKKFSNKKQKPLIPKSRADRFTKALNFINLYLKKMSSIILRDKFLEYYGQIIGIGTLNQSFFMDDLLIPQEIPIITFSQKKGFALIDQQTERVLLMVYIFIKHLLFKVLFKIRQKKVIEKKLKQDEYKKYEDNLDQIYQFMDMVSMTLYTLINNLFGQHLEEVGDISNYDSLKTRFKVEPAKLLTTPNCPKNLKEKINYKELILGVQIDQGLLNQLQRKQHQDYLGFIVSQVQDFVQNLRLKTKQINKLIYDHVRETTLQEPYIIFEGIKSEQQQMIKTSKTIKNSKKPRNSDMSGLSNTSLGALSKAGKKGKR